MVHRQLQIKNSIQLAGQEKNSDEKIKQNSIGVENKAF